MMVPDNRRDFSQRRVLSNHVSSNIWMPPHDFPLLFAKRTGFVENVVANANLAKVVKRTRGANEFALSITKLEMLTQIPGQLRNPYGVRLRVPISGVKSLGGQIKRLVFEHRLTLNVSDGAANRQNETEESWRYDITHRKGLGIQQHIENAACKVEGNGWDHCGKSHVVQENRPE
jgi:hypothetical protein